MPDSKISNLTELTAPVAEDELVIVDKSDTTMAASGTTKKVQAIEILQDLTHNATAKTTPVDADEIGLIDSAASFVLKKLTFLNLKYAVGSYLNPVGTIREFNVATNPNTLLGFGTWSAFGTGRVTVAIDAGQTEFDTNGETGGAKTHLLTSAESGLPAHTHPIPARDSDDAGTNAAARGTDAGVDFASRLSTAANAASAHNNLQPYIVVYRWVRTA